MQPLQLGFNEAGARAPDIARRKALTLDGDSTIVLRAMDVLTLEGRTRTAATFVAEAPSTQIDVATVIVNMMTGSTDTVNYEPEDAE